MPGQFFSPEGDLEEYFMTNYWLIDQYIGDKLYVWGNGTFGALGNNLSAITRLTPITTFAGGSDWKQVSGSDTTLAIKTDGTLWGWGANGNAAIGNNASAIVITPITTFAGGTNWKQVSSGDAGTAAIKTDGTLWIWGSNNNNALGINEVAGTKLTPVTTFAGGSDWSFVNMGNTYTSAIKVDGTLWVWGNNQLCQLGTNDTINRSTPVTTFAGGTDWKQISCGDTYVGAVKNDGTLWVWGNNNAGQLGTGILTPVSTPVTTFAGGTNWKQISTGESNGHMAAIKNDGTLWVWGSNFNASLGINAGAGSRITPVTTFAGGTNWKYVCAGVNGNAAAIKTDGTLWVWGIGSEGRLGNISTLTVSTPVTTFAGGTNWRQVYSSRTLKAVTSGIPSDLPLS